MYPKKTQQIVLSNRDIVVNITQVLHQLGVQHVCLGSGSRSTPLMLAFSQKYQFSFPYLFDETQGVAKDYQAECTPDFFLFDKERKLFYRGQLDSSRPSNDIPVSGQDLVQAVCNLNAGELPPRSQKPSVGCNIKWKRT